MSHIHFESMNILELYSGIGGMHLAFQESGVEGKVVAAIEINPVANTIYRYNFSNTMLLEANIEGLTVNDIRNLNVNTILMSPPCQPFTRNGLQKDIQDSRTASFSHILKLLPDLSIENILVENVKGFETSQMRDFLVEVLSNCNFTYQEFILNPLQFGIPNSRTRYYCLAKRKPNTFFADADILMNYIPNVSVAEECFPISQSLECNIDNKYFLTDTMLQKRHKILDICSADSKRSCCFTKAYGRFFEGTGSILTDKNMSYVKEVFKKIEDIEEDSEEIVRILRTLNLRFFSPKEICRLMHFPESFGFPHLISDSKRYTVLGNSINIKVVSMLIKYMNS